MIMQQRMGGAMISRHAAYQMELFGYSGNANVQIPQLATACSYASAEA